jgi:hypothetical protein
MAQTERGNVFAPAGKERIGFSTWEVAGLWVAAIAAVVAWSCRRRR